MAASVDGGATWSDLGRQDIGAVSDLALGVDGRNLYAATAPWIVAAAPGRIHVARPRRLPCGRFGPADRAAPDPVVYGAVSVDSAVGGAASCESGAAPPVASVTPSTARDIVTSIAVVRRRPESCLGTRPPRILRALLSTDTCRCRRSGKLELPLHVRNLRLGLHLASRQTVAIESCRSALTRSECVVAQSRTRSQASRAMLSQWRCHVSGSPTSRRPPA